jgi:hypothetical protein
MVDARDREPGGHAVAGRNTRPDAGLGGDPAGGGQRPGEPAAGPQPRPGGGDRAARRPGSTAAGRGRRGLAAGREPTRPAVRLALRIRAAPAQGRVVGRGRGWTPCLAAAAGRRPVDRCRARQGRLVCGQRRCRRGRRRRSRRRPGCRRADRGRARLWPGSPLSARQHRPVRQGTGRRRHPAQRAPARDPAPGGQLPPPQPPHRRPVRRRGRGRGRRGIRQPLHRPRRRQPRRRPHPRRPRRPLGPRRRRLQPAHPRRRHPGPQPHRHPRGGRHHRTRTRPGHGHPTSPWCRRSRWDCRRFRWDCRPWSRSRPWPGCRAGPSGPSSGVGGSRPSRSRCSDRADRRADADPGSAGCRHRPSTSRSGHRAAGS